LANSDDGSDKAFAVLFELFSKSSKAHQKAYRKYDLKIENGEPVFSLSEFDRVFDEILEKWTGFD